MCVCLCRQAEKIRLLKEKGMIFGVLPRLSTQFIHSFCFVFLPLRGRGQVCLGSCPVWSTARLYVVVAFFSAMSFMVRRGAPGFERTMYIDMFTCLYVYKARASPWYVSPCHTQSRAIPGSLHGDTRPYSRRVGRLSGDAYISGSLFFFVGVVVVWFLYYYTWYIIFRI